MAAYAVEVRLDVYDDDVHTWVVGGHRNYETAKQEAQRLEAQLQRGAVRDALEGAYGEGGYYISAIPTRVRTAADLVRELKDRT